MFELGTVVEALETWLAGDDGEGLLCHLRCGRGWVFNIGVGFQEERCYFRYVRHCEFVFLDEGTGMLWERIGFTVNRSWGQARATWRGTIIAGQRSITNGLWLVQFIRQRV